MKKLLLTVALCAATFWVIRAQSQRGTVMIQNSGKKALPQVNIVIEGATPTTSDARGCFEVQLPNHIEGQRLLIQQIAYRDWVVVNQHMVNQWVYAPTKNYRVDMCAKEEYTARVEQFYQIGKTNAKAKYTSAMAQLKQLKEEGKMNSDRYMQRRKEIQAALNTAQEMLDCYVPLLVAINTDYLEPIEKQAQQLVTQGKLDEAIGLYEGLQLEKRLAHDLGLKKQWDEDIESMIPTVERYAQTLVLQGGEESYRKAGDLFKKIADSSPTHMDRNADYANFAYHQRNFTDAETYYKKAIEHSKTPYDLADWYTKLGLIYDDMNRLDESIGYFDKAQQLLEKLPRNILATAELTVNLDINLSTVLFKMVRKGTPETKLKGCRIALNSLKEAVKILLALGPTQAPDYESKLMVCYQNMTTIYGVMGDKKGLEQAQADIAKLNMTDAKADTQVEYWVAKGNNANYKKKYDEMLAAYLKADEIIEKLYRNNPSQYKIERITIYQLLAAAYYELDRYVEAVDADEEGLAIFNTLPDEEQSTQRELYYNLYYNLYQCYYYTQQHNEAYDAIEKIHPFLKTEASEYAINIWFTALNAAYNLGRYEILKYSEEIIETLKACQDNKAVYSQVNACYAFLGALFFNTGHVDTALYFYDLSDKCATQHGHVRMLAYNKLNRLSLNLTGHRAQEVVADAPAIETELKKREGDNDSFAQLKYIQMMAYMMLGQWNEANRISQLMNQMPPQDAAVGRARALLAQAVLCIHTKQEAKPYFDRFMTEAEDARRSSLFMYHELMADYYFVCLYYAMQNKQYKQASEITAKLADVMNNLTEESPIRGVYMQIQFLNKCGDLAYFTHHYQKALDIYESTISLF
ncbi:hypothetical protein BOVA172_4266 [Bacteroides ovatus]|nr:tetratricopeptide repeat protein [Bacteroides ovatus]CAG9919360.1 hypothetical protein BOVA172_4266 [Bacteroides ovatus]